MTDVTAEVTEARPTTVMSVPLSPYATELLRLLTGAADESDPAVRHVVDLSRIDDRELGVLLAVAHELPARELTVVHPGRQLRWALTGAIQERQPRFPPESCAALLAALAKDFQADHPQGNPLLAVGALLRCDGQWPATATRSAVAIVRAMVARGRSEQPYAMMALAGLAGGPTRVMLNAMFRRSLAPIARDELELLTKLGAPAQALVAEVCRDRPYPSMPQLPDAWQRLAAIEEYVAFARRALDAARARVASIQAGELPYVADKAFAPDEVEVLGRAVRVALRHDEAWLPELLRSLLLGVAVAPTSARTLPSQALLYEAARAAGDFPTPEALATLLAVRGVVRHKGVPRQLDRMCKRIERALAERTDTVLRLPDLGFGPDGTVVVEVGGHRAVLVVSDEVVLRWRRADGTLSPTVPAVVRRDQPDELGELRGRVKQARDQVTALARTLEAGYPAASAQPYGQWRAELAGNGLGWQVVRRLIWEVRHPGGEWRAVLPDGDAADERFVDAFGGSVARPEPDAALRLWHPIRSGVDEVRAWRDLLTERRLRQPVRQAFREVYLLTPAEEETGTYSLRFAAHIVHYRQLYPLLRSRGWTTQMLGPWDGGDAATAYRVLASGAWRIGLHHDYLREEDVECASTGRVWFERSTEGAWRTGSLTEVPPVVFSEAMRDVDLFVSVTSIAADPYWTDRRTEHGDYWRAESRRELGTTAQVRRTALERILPRTKIADRCTLTDRYLVVRGELRTYKIHLGSANILMEPDDTYLCIVPARRKPPGEVFLPFEEDRLGLILSKAFLLADDARITDESIVAQLRARR
ncbi:DUF4132 domain-containing protein [Plantactinospora sp. S1510]|uniref:DUF4132 domain-containing protein n=1 Tax=Plantactinospora alkalitolerans TaxID=2789879 RepID=A0ABS0H0G9_9ACTN|nr:DUF4132 domain-containing protein [Plantactinospora alkalitolerans]MBF9131953.1 DUF4132 domain-containing protein [Plantactinospora alkalitolerans]